MKSKKIALIVLLAALIIGCKQEVIVELPLTMHVGYGPFSAGMSGMSLVQKDENSPWKNTYPEISKFPEELADMKYGFIETNYL